MKKYQTQIEVLSDERVVLFPIKPRRDRKPPFILMGNGGHNRTGMAMDMILIINALPAGSARLLDVLVKARDKDTNKVVLLPSLFADPRAIWKYFPALTKQRLAIRITHCHYMINPDAFMSNEYLPVKAEWDRLTRQ